MPTKTIGGLDGKARRERVRNRAARLFARQLVKEYLEPDEVSPGVERYVPIRSRSEFLPSAAPPWIVDLTTASDKPRPSEQAKQLDLPFVETNKTQVDCPVSFPSEVTPDRNESHESPAVLRIPPPKRSRQEPAAPALRPGRRKPFTFGGFLLGCAMGSAAAVMMLMVAQAVVR